MKALTRLELIRIQKHGTREERRASIAEQARRLEDGDVKERPWDWPTERAELLALAERLTPDDALAIVGRLLAVEVEGHLAPFLAGLIRGSVARREDERRREA